MSLDTVQQAAQEQFNRQSARYGRTHILADVRDVDAALAHTAPPPGSAVLDVATGGGHTGLRLAELGHRVILADLAEGMLNAAHELAEERGLSVETRQHSAEALPYADETFDLVTCRVAPHHFSSPESFVAETARVLRPSGYFVLIDGSVPDGEPDAEEWIHRLEKLRDPSHNRFLPPAAWRRLCEQGALTVVHCELTPMKQPDLEWYFETANTPAENRAAVREMIRTAPDYAYRIFRTHRGKWEDDLVVAAVEPRRPEVTCNEIGG
jgi:ubiquinone/menaquinone biosynthesis C-methylase UbiE